MSSEGASAFQVVGSLSPMTTRVSSSFSPRTVVSAKAGPEKTTKKKKEQSAWERYTDGEYGQAFKLPWEDGVKGTDKTAIGHILPTAVTLGILICARLQEMPSTPL